MSSQERWPPAPLRESAPETDVRTDDSRSSRDVFEGLASRRRRRLLAILMDGSSPVAEADLASRLAAVEEGASPLDVPEEKTDRLRTELRHVDLPALADVGLVEWDDVEEAVVAADHPAYEDPDFRDLVTTSDDVDEVVDCLTSERRRLVLAVLESHQEPIDVEELAGEVSTFESAGGTSDPESDVLVSLHHVHLPKLEDAGLVERDDGEIAYRHHPVVKEEWFTF